MQTAVNLTLNGEARAFDGPMTVAALLATLGLETRKVAVERNEEIVPRSSLRRNLAAQRRCAGDRAFHRWRLKMDGSLPADDTWTVAGRTFPLPPDRRHRPLQGPGGDRRRDRGLGAEIVTVAVRRVNLSDPKAPMLQDYVDPKKYTYLPNTAGCHTANEAVRTLRLAREAGGWNLVKLEVLGPPPMLYPDMRGTFEAAEALIKDGFEVMVYSADDPVACQAAARRWAASPSCRWARRSARASASRTRR